MMARWGRILWSSAPFLLTLASFTWCTNTVMVRGLAHDVPPMGLAFWRMAAATVFVAAIGWNTLRADAPSLLKHWKLMLILGATGIGGFNLLIYVGLQTTTALHTLLLQSVIPVTIIGCAALLYRERPSLLQSLAIAISLVGVAVIVGHGSIMEVLRLEIVRGDAWVFAAMIFYGFYSVLLRRLPRLHPMSFLFGSFLAASLVLLPSAVWEGITVGPVPASPRVLLACLYLAVVPSTLAYLCFNRGVALIGAARAGQYVHLVPVFGSLLAVFWLGEAFGPYLLVGIALIAAGLVLANRTAGAPKASLARGR